MYLKGGSIIPVGPPYQHVGEANPTDDLCLFVALDEHGNVQRVKKILPNTILRTNYLVGLFYYALIDSGILEFQNFLICHLKQELL